MDKIIRINMGAEGGPQVRVESLGKYAGWFDINDCRKGSSPLMPSSGRA